MKLTMPQQNISADGARFQVVAAGRRVGKSFLSINELAKHARHPNQRCLYVAPTYRQAKTVIWDELKSQLYRVNWISKVNESDLTITLVNGSTISIRSSDNKDSLRGTKYNFIVLDECAFMQQDVWYSVLRPTLSDTGGSALFITSPSGRNWVYDLWINAGREQDWSAHQYTTLDGGQVPEAEIEAARRDLDSKRFEQEYLASFVTWAGTIFYAYSDEHNLKQWEGDINTIRALHLSIDFNTSPITCGVWAQHRDTLHCIDEIEIFGSNTNELVEEIINRYGRNRQYFAYPDASGSRTQTSSQGISDHIILH
ncbi:MAG: terminase large subunit, partial [Candidatus Poseidoniales archaeon]